MELHKSGNCDSDDDPVVSEFPVYHSTNLEDNLYLFQYKCDITASLRGEVNKVNFKPENEELNFKVGMDTSGSSFNGSRTKFGEDDTEEYVSISSRKSVSEPEYVTVGAFNGKEFHLTTVKNVFKLDVDYQQPEKKQDKNNKKTASSDDEAGPSSARQVTVKFKQTPRSNQKQMISSKNHTAKSASEKWIECDLVKPENTISKNQKQKLFTEYMHETDQANNLTEIEYLKQIVPKDEEQSINEPSLPSHLISLNALRALPLLEQCRLLLKGSQIVQFQQILMLLAGSSGLTNDSLLKTLPKVAVLVRGNWVVKSEVLYPPETMSPICGVPSENMCRARDYLLYLFTKNQFVERKKVASIVKVPAEEVKEIFKGVSSLRHNKGWELNLDTDFDFIAKHPDIEQRQTLLWEQRYIQVCDFLKEKKRRKSRSESKSFSEDKKSGHCNSSDNDSGTEKTKSPPRKKKKMPE
ncbi:DNA-directed RNA polymerase III subunit RPC5 [Harmonia axyridis]|uniref:DNA-directed RNA polymerase III subunit RPC5 n=1 Tax=Harmonia axyridis TaxID=115357 RepID=UPI001E278136|nr:DNA-directed RNA polymerase III subunit RPC5 [Harmonia axyridis]